MVGHKLVRGLKHHGETLDHGVGKANVTIVFHPQRDSLGAATPIIFPDALKMMRHASRRGCERKEED